MKTIELGDLTQNDIDSAAEVVISGVKAYNSRLDTRKGTVLRDLLVDPESAIEGVIEKQIQELRAATSLKSMEKRESSGGEIDENDVSAVLSNFNMSIGAGKKASGIVKIVVNDNAISYIAAEGMRIKTIDGIEFEVSERVVACSDDVENPSIKPTTKLYKGTAGYFFLAKVDAVEVGSQGNIKQGTALSSPGGAITYISMEAYKDFDGGLDALPLDKTIDNIPSALSLRGFVNKTAVEGMLRASFDHGDFPMTAVSSVGYGNGAQRRDKHNAFGVGVGGRVDVYVRNFGDLFTVTKTVTGTIDGGKYKLHASQDDFPGACWIKSVEDMVPSGYSSSTADDQDHGDQETVLGGFDFSAKRTADVSKTWHDIDADDDHPEEAFNSVWQGFDIELYEVPPDVAPETDGGGWTWSDSREFKVTAYCLPQSMELQEYVDDDAVRSIASDVVVRCPIICRVSVNATVRYDPANPMDEESAKAKIRSYINGLGFVGRLTRSEIVHVLKEQGAVSVDMPSKDMLYGKMHDAHGNEVTVQGDALDIGTVSDDAAMLTPDTVIFAAEREDIQIVMLPNTK